MKNLKLSFVFAITFLWAFGSYAAGINSAFSSSAAGEWKPGAGSSVAQQAKLGTGVIFPCRFRSSQDRCFWDYAIKTSGSDCDGFELEFSCDFPAKVRALSIYVKSGGGWYSTELPVTQSGRQIKSLQKNSFKTQGKVAGWNQIDGIRISPWKGEAGTCNITVSRMQPKTERIVLLQGTVSAGETGERNASRRSADRISRLLEEYGIGHARLTDEQLTEQALRGVKLLILAYNPAIPSGEYNLIRRFVERGGKLIVFYSSDARLARLMGFELGPYQREETVGQWSMIQFIDASSWHVPKVVYQHSSSNRPVYARRYGARVMAWWANSSGKKGKDPAWVASQRGAWMTHIIRESDFHNKASMLLGIIGHYEPSVWPRAAEMARRRAGRVNGYNNYMSAVRDIEKLAGKSQHKIKALQHLGRANSYFSDMISCSEHQKYADAVDQGRLMRAELVRAYALVQEGRAGEFRGVWDHSGLGLYPGDWDRTCRELARQGVTAIFPNVAWGGVALYKSEVLPQANSVRLYGDQLAACVHAARKHGLEVHAWLVCWSLEGAPLDFIRQMKREKRLLCDSKGRTINWLNPAVPANQQLMRSVCREMVAKYDIDGVHLDYIRYKDAHSGSGAESRRLYQKQKGRAVTAGQSLPGGAQRTDYNAWRVENVNAVVVGLRRDLLKIRSSVKLSAAVWGGYPQSIYSIAQDWGRWLSKGELDFVCPMNYSGDLVGYRELLRKQLKFKGARGRIYSGIGVSSTESQLTPDEVIEQIVTGRKMGVPGFVLFKLNAALLNNVLPELREGISSK